MGITLLSGATGFAVLFLFGAGVFGAAAVAAAAFGAARLRVVGGAGAVAAGGAGRMGCCCALGGMKLPGW